MGVLTIGSKKGGIPDTWNCPSVGFSLVSANVISTIVIRLLRPLIIIMDFRPIVASAMELAFYN
ncbi:MAG: hypothetical protein IPN36_02575 [Bacteroidetes bacterium]|nr:hypothetical protein [Bacteroidota bacterium]